MSPSVWPKAIPLLVLATLLAYANCVPKTLVFDDDAWIVDQASLDDPEAYVRAMSGRPVLAVTNLAMHRFGRNNPIGHHVLNVLIHIAAGLTLYGLVRRSLLRPRFGGRYAGRAPYLAFAATLLWLLHPIQVQCVTYVIQRCESLAGLFYLLILYAMLRANENWEQHHAADAIAGATRGSGMLQRLGWYALAVISLVLGYASKEIMVTVPAAVLIFDRVFLANSVREVIRRRWVFYLFFLITWGGFTAWHLTRAAGAESGIGFGQEAVTPKKYALTEAGVLLYYLKISALPRGLAIDYQGWPWRETVSDAMPEAAVVAGMLLVTLVLLFWRTALGYVCLWFFLVLAPTSSVLPIVDAVFEHRLYLSLASVAILGVFLGDVLLRRTGLGALRPYALAAAGLALGVLTHLRNEEYRSRAAVWEVAVNRMPDSVRARSNYAQGLLLDDRPAEAVPVLERGLEIIPHDPTSLVNLGAAHEQLGEFASAAECYRRLRDYYPSDWRNWRMHGAALLVVGRWADADEAYRRGIEAEEAKRKTTEIEPAVAQLYYGRAAALRKLGMDGDALEAMRAATAIDSNWPAAVLGLARMAIMDEKLRKSPDARRSALTWAELGMQVVDRPGVVELDTLGLCYAGNGEFEKAADVCRRALKEQPMGPWGAVHRDRLRFYEQKRVPWPE
jgi:protein O-mannosyl-transferase